MAEPQTPTHTAPASSTATSDRHSRSGHAFHNRGKKGDDPFLTRSLTAEVGEQFRQPSPGQANDSQAEHDNSLLADLIITPLTMISFIFSLLLVDRQQRRWRLSQHSPDTTSAGWSGAWLTDPEPYQVAAAPGQRGASEKGSADASSGGYIRKKKRAMARMEISDALEMRKRVVVALLVWSALVLWLVYYLLRCIYGWAFGT